MLKGISFKAICKAASIFKNWCTSLNNCHLESILKRNGTSFSCSKDDGNDCSSIGLV